MVLRRNQEAFALRVPTVVSAVERGSILELYPLGLVVNPRSKEPLLVVTDGTNVGIRSLRETTLLMRHGSGYYDTSGHGKSKQAENLTGLPRSHTPSGATPRGDGYGTSLYTALSLGAYQVDNDHAEIEMDMKGDGVSSESEGRSREADAWWNAAHARGLTDRETENTEEEQEYVKLDMDSDDLERCADLDEGQSIKYVNEVNVDLVTEQEFSVDLYSYSERAWVHDLVPVEFQLNSTGFEEIPDDIQRGTELRWLVELALEDPGIFGDANPTALLALDVRGLDVQAMNLLSLCYMQAGLGDKEVDALWYRHNHGLDPGQEVRQLGLYDRPERVRWDLLTPNQRRQGGLSDVIEARKQADWASLASLP